MLRSHGTCTSCIILTAHVHTHTHTQVASIQQEFDGYQQRGVSHGSLVQYLSMSYTHARNKIVVEVRVCGGEGGGCEGGMV